MGERFITLPGVCVDGPFRTYRHLDMIRFNFPYLKTQGYIYKPFPNLIRMYYIEEMAPVVFPVHEL